MRSVVFFAALPEVQFPVLSVLNLSRQGFLATCPIGHCYVRSLLLFASEILCDSPGDFPTYSGGWALVGGRFAWKPKMHDVFLGSEPPSSLNFQSC